MNKKKRIKELEERVAQLERARSIYNEYWQTHIVGLEQRIELLETRLNTWYWYPMGLDYLLWREPDDAWKPYSPTTTPAYTAEGLKRCPTP